MATGDQIGYATYLSDNGKSYTVKISDKTAGVNGVGLTFDPMNLTNPPWPYGAKNLRHITGVNAAGTKRCRVPIMSSSNAYYQGGGSFTIDAGTFRTTGAEGERRIASAIS